MSRTFLALAVSCALAGCTPSASTDVCTPTDPHHESRPCSAADEGRTMCAGVDGYSCRAGCWRFSFDLCHVDIRDVGPRDTSGDPHGCLPAFPGDLGPRGDGDHTCPASHEGDRNCVTSGWGYACLGGCWTRFFDGPCWPPTCGSPGTLGGSCAGGVCSPGRCEEPFRDPIEGTRPTLSELGVGLGEADPDHPGFGRSAAAPDPSDLVPLSIATGTLCTQRCDPTAETDPCGTCATCSLDVGVAGLVRLPEVLPTDDLAFGEHTGWCRLDCTFDPETRGACPDGYTCSAASEVCVEGCTSDVECQTRIVPTWEGDRVSIRDATAATCDPATLRCRWTHDGEHSVGDSCSDASDCTADVGTCLPGGVCGELGCHVASDTDEYLCDGGRGVCAGHGNRTSVCLPGCLTVDDCAPMQTCVGLGGTTVGTFTGLCTTRCDTIASDPDGAGPLTEANDEIVACRATERCDMPAPTAVDDDPDGTCRAPCAVDADCLPGTRCAFDTGATEGLCRPPTR